MVFRGRACALGSNHCSSGWGLPTGRVTGPNRFVTSTISTSGEPPRAVRVAIGGGTWGEAAALNWLSRLLDIADAAPALCEPP